MESNISWDYYRSFLSVLKEGSLSGAARALGMTQPTIGRHVDALESSLGLVLFTRSQAGLLPTEAAQALQGYIQDMEHTAAALARAAASRSDEVDGVVRVTASEVVGTEILPSIVAVLRARHPRLAVELALSNRLQDLLHREADIAVRMTPPQQAQLIARHVGRIELGLHAHHDYLAAHGQPTTAAELAEHALIGFDQVTPFIRAAMKSFPGMQREAFSMRTDSDVAQLALVRAGAGIGICQVPLARRNASLVRILPDEVRWTMDVWITMHEDMRNSPRCRAMFDALVEGLLQYTAEE